VSGAGGPPRDPAPDTTAELDVEDLEHVDDGDPGDEHVGDEDVLGEEAVAAPEPFRIGVLVSGHGTNLQALIDAAARGELAPATIAVVVSNKPGVAALARAEKAGVPAVVVEHAGLERDVFEDRLLAALAAHRVDAVVLAGFMRVLTARFVDRFPLRIINTHPSLLPAFPGVDATGQAIRHGVKLSGLTIHFVDGSLDGGPIIAQVAVPVQDGDDGASLHARIQREEHRLLPDVVRRLAAGRLSCQGRHVTSTGGRAE
jgi:formyltetrahydrofolate-dependent phosphoribosylglycinamide formyltransferase